MGLRKERLAGNEAMFREVNERVVDVAEQFLDIDPAATPVDFRCECGAAGCVEQIAMTLAEYEAVRADPTHFAVLPGHETLDIEQVVERHPNYLVVEKQDSDAEEVARETDPRT